MNDSNDTRDRKEELGTLCYYKVFVLVPVKQYSVIWKWTWTSSKCILQTLGQSLKKFKKNSKKTQATKTDSQRSRKSEYLYNK